MDATTLAGEPTWDERVLDVLALFCCLRRKESYVKAHEQTPEQPER